MKYTKSQKKYIRNEKSRIRKEFTDVKKQEEAITKLLDKMSGKLHVHPVPKVKRAPVVKKEPKKTPMAKEEPKEVKKDDNK